MAFWTHFTRGPPLARRSRSAFEMDADASEQRRGDWLLGELADQSPHAVGDETEGSPIRVWAKQWRPRFCGSQRQLQLDVVAVGKLGIDSRECRKIRGSEPDA